MALGTYDANGIWHYGESDNIALFSDTLNKLADSASSAFTSDRSRLATLEAGSLSGLVPVVPTSIDKTGGTASANALGVVTFSGVSSLSLNNIFTTNYRNYKLVGSITSTAACALNAQMRAAGANNAGANYSYAGLLSRVTATGGYVGGSTVTALVLTYLNSPSSGEGMVEFTIGSPRQAEWTEFLGNTWGADAAGLMSFNIGGLHTVATAFDGFTIYPSAGTISGVLQVYGLND